MGLQRGTRFGALMLLLGLSVAACDEGTSPDANFDAQQTAAAMQDMVGAVNAGEMANAAASLSAASGLFTNGAAASLAAEPVNPSVATLRGLVELGSVDFFPAEYLGVTFEWSTTEMAYVPSDLTGAPSDGIRILYYAVDPFSGVPATPLNVLGHVDLRDLSTVDSDRLGVMVVSTSGDADVTLADYYLDLAYTLTQSSLTLDVASVGYLSNGTDQLNFDVAQGMSLTETELSITQDYSLDLEGTDTGMSFSAVMTADPQSQSEDPATMEAEALITGNGQSVRLEISWADNVLEGTVYSNTVPVVLISGTLDEPVFTDTNGDPLTQEQLNALQSVWEAIGEIFDFVEGLFSFAA